MYTNNTQIVTNILCRVLKIAQLEKSQENSCDYDNVYNTFLNQRYQHACVS